MTGNTLIVLKDESVAKFEFNFEELKKWALEQVEKYQNLMITEDQVIDIQKEMADINKYAKEIEKKYSRYIDGNTLPRFSLKHIISSSKGASSKTVLLYILPLDNENQIHFEGGKFGSPEEIEADEHNYSSFLKEEIEHLDVVALMWKEFK